MYKLVSVLAGLLLALALLPAQAATPMDPATHFFNDTFGNYHEELANAKAEGKQGVFVFFEMDECPFCHYMKTHILNQPEIQAYYRQHFLNFPLDIEGDVEITTFQNKVMKQKDFAFKVNRVRATPVLAFYDLNGKQVYRYTGRTADAQEFLWMGKYVAEGYYKKMPFIKFKRQMRKAAR